MFVIFVFGENGRHPPGVLVVQEEHELEWLEDEVELWEDKYDIDEGDQGGWWVHVHPRGCNQWSYINDNQTNHRVRNKSAWNNKRGINHSISANISTNEDVNYNTQGGIRLNGPEGLKERVWLDPNLL